MPKPRDPNDQNIDDQTDDQENLNDGDEGETQEDDATLDAADETGDAEDDQGADDSAEDDDQEAVDDGEPPRRPSRAQTRIQRLARETREANERATRLEREMAELRAAQRPQQAAGETPEARAARRALLSPEEAMREDLRESEARINSQLQTLAVQQRDARDETAYNGILRDAPHLRKYAPEVDKMLREMQAQGQWAPREALLDIAVGRAVRQAAAKRGPDARKEGQRKIAQQRTKPANTRGDTAPDRGRQSSNSLERRLADVPI